MDYYKKSLEIHEQYKGKISIESKVPVTNKEELSVAYTPGVAEPCKEIAKDPTLAYKYTTKGNMVAVVTDGSAVLGLGNIGPLAALPVMEGKCILFKEFAGVDAVPICLSTQDSDEIIKTVVNIAPTYGGINLEDISAPRCFEIEAALKEKLDIPVFHDDQHGTAIVASAAVINAVKLVGKDIKSIKLVINGAGSAGIATAKMFMSLGVTNIILCDRHGILTGNEENPAQCDMAKQTNPEKVTGTLSDALNGADVFVGLSAPKVVSADMVSSMADKSVVLAMANPEPEILPELAKEAGVYVMGTGRSDYPNQINNVLAFPGIFKGALSSGAKQITDDMKVAAAYAIAACVSDDELSPDMVIPSPFNPKVAEAVAEAVRQSWFSTQA